MGMIFRVAFNNQNWMGKCTNAKDDRRLFNCQKLKVNIGWGEFKVDNRGTCRSDCLEAELCIKYLWESFQGNFNQKRAIGTVYFVYPYHLDNSLVLWGKSKIKNVKENRIYFEEFKPMPENKWKKDLRSKNILGKAM